MTCTVRRMRVCELFSGIGAQHCALDAAGIDAEYVCCEIDPQAYAAYCAIHGDTPNLGDITKVEHLPECDLLTFSWPCQSVSIQGKKEGMVEGSGTESALLWEAIRLLKDASKLPEFLCAENVPAVLNKRNKPELDRMLSVLESLGYTASYQVLNAKDYGVPQNRKRFFMVASLTHGRFIFPEPCPDGRVLKDVLEPEQDVPQKCWLSDERIERYEAHYQRQKAAGNGFGWDPTDGSKIAKTVTTKADRQYSNYLIQCGHLDLPGWSESLKRVYSPEGICPTICTSGGGGHMPRFEVESNLDDLTPFQQICNCIIAYMVLSDEYGHAKEAYARGILSRMRDKDGAQDVDESTDPETRSLLDLWKHVESGCPSHRWESVEQYRRGFAGVMSELSYESTSQEIDLCDLWRTREGTRLLQQALHTLSEVWGSFDDKDAELLYLLWRTNACEGIMRKALSSCKKSGSPAPIKIRYISPREAFRLMGFSDEAYEKVKALGYSDTVLYRLAGNSIAVPCLAAIFRAMYRPERKSQTTLDGF